MNTMKPRVTSFAPQFLVDDLERSIAYYQKIGFTFGEPWELFYAIVVLDGHELHWKEAPKNDVDRQHRRNNDHLDASAGVDGGCKFSICERGRKNEALMGARWTEGDRVERSTTHSICTRSENSGTG